MSTSSNKFTYLDYQDLIDEFIQEIRSEELIKKLLPTKPQEPKKTNLYGAFVDTKHKYKKYIMIQLNIPQKPTDNIYHIGIVEIDRNGSMTTLLFKNNDLAVSDRLQYKFSLPLYFKNIKEIQVYFDCLSVENRQLCLDHYVSGLPNLD